MSFSTVSKSSKSTEYGTPIEFFTKLNNIFHFKLDPCTTEDNPLGTEKYITSYYNGLTVPWDENTYVNPPFGKGISRWLYHMYSQATIHEDKKYVMLLPARTDTKWFQEQIMTTYKDDSVIYFLKGRLKFVNPVLNGKSEPHIIGSMLWIMNSNDKDLYELKQAIPGILLKDWK